MKTVFRILVISLIAFFIIWFFLLKDLRDNRLMKKGDNIIEKIEKFKVENNRLPNTLFEIGIVEKEGVDEIWYQIIDSTNCNYIIAYGVSMDRSKIYFSDSKKWENSFRYMENESK